MNYKRIIFAGFATTVFATIVAAFTCGGVFNWVYSLEPADFFKPMEKGPEPIYLVGSLLVNVIFAFVYALLAKGIPGVNKFVKGLIYGLCVWSVGVLPGMISMYFFTVLNPVVILYWLIWGLVVLPIQGVIVSKIYERGLVPAS
jgi:hypothetical protein